MKQNRVLLGSLGLLVVTSLVVGVFVDRPNPGFGKVPQHGLERAYNRDDFTQSAKVADILADINFDLKNNNVPVLFAPVLPVDLSELPTAERKSMFINLLLPIGLAANAEVLAERDQFELAIRSKSRSKLEPIAQRYGYEVDDVFANPEKLRRRLDVVPVPLMIAQGIEESAWGTSRFAREGNNLFGQQGPGMIPLEATDGRTMAAYPTLRDAVRSYVFNLNTHPAYEQFRNARAIFRAQNKVPDAHVLAGTLTRYSERGLDYVNGLKSIMYSNNLKSLAHAQLSP